MPKLEQCPKCGSKNIMGIEYWDNSEHYDGISEYECQSCKYRQGRWTGKELPEEYIESRLGVRGVIKRELAQRRK